MKKGKSFKFLDQRGSAGFLLIIVIFILIVIDMALGISETSLNIMVLNEVTDIIENAMPVSIRKGVSKEEHKNESIRTRYDKTEILNDFVDTVSRSIEKINFRGKILTSSADIKQELRDNTQIKGSANVAFNTWVEGSTSSDKKEIDYIIMSTVLPLELENKYAKVDTDRIEKTFNVMSQSDSLDDVRKRITVDVDISGKGLGTFIIVEMKIILS